MRLEKCIGVWMDENSNMWKCSHYSREEAEKLSETLKNCTNCLDCLNCTDCNDCWRCHECIRCVSCGDCESCEDCQKICNGHGLHGKKRIDDGIIIVEEMPL